MKSAYTTPYAVAVITITILILLTWTAAATTGSMVITSPANAFSTVTSSIPITTQIKTNETSIEARATLAGTIPYTIQLLPIKGGWGGTIVLPSNQQNGNFYLSAQFRTKGGNWVNADYGAWINVNLPIQSPSPTPQPSPTPSPSPTQTPTPTGSILFTVKDIDENYMQGVTIQPGGVITNEFGQYILDNQPINQTLNFILTKSPYVNNYTSITLTNTNRLPQVITMRRSGDTIRKFTVSGYDDYITTGSMSYLKIKDSITDESIDGAKVILFSGNTVKSLPGNTTGGRATVSFTEAGYYELVIEKNGYEDWSQAITVTEARSAQAVTTPPPPPVPTPVPTPVKIFRADVGAAVTDDEYRAWMETKEKEQAAQNNNTSNIIPPTPTTAPPKPYAAIGVLGMIGLGVVAIVYKKKTGKEQPQIEDTLNIVGPEAEDTTDPADSKTMTLSCEKCEWTKEIPADSTPEIVKMFREAHLKDHK